MSRKCFLNQYKVAGLILILALLPEISLGNAKIGTITQVSGEVALLTHPGPTAAGASPRVLYENIYYTAKTARVGDKLDKENVLQTSTNGRARLIFPNGDHITVGPGTSYSLSWQNEEKKEPEESDALNLIYGKIRAVISHSGPRSGIMVKTPVAVAGVRGTDFHVQYNPAGGEILVSVLRGEMEVKVKHSNLPGREPQAESEKTVTVATGQKVEVQNPAALVREPTSVSESSPDAQPASVVPVSVAEATVKMAAITRQELVEIQKHSTLPEKKDLPASKVDEQVATQVMELEKKAVANTLVELKQYSPELYNKLAQEQEKDLSVINAATVGKLYQQAPEVKKGKPLEGELKDIDQDVYRKYFGQ